MANEPVDTVADVVTKPKPPKWLDGLYFSVDGVLVTREERAFDHRVLQTIKRKRVDRDSQLAAELGVSISRDRHGKYEDTRFEACLFRLQQKGCIIRIQRTWHYEGYWEDLPSPTLSLTAKGEWLSMERIPED
jgi:hypothetical protein